MSALRLRHAVAVALSGAFLSATLAGATPAHADDAPVKGTGKGIVGGALLGGEAGFIVLSAAGAKQSWLYYTIPTALAIGGGVGGYFIEKGQEGTSAEAPMYMLAAGMALIIPTVVITLSATSYNPANDDTGPVTVDSGTTSSGNGLGVKVDAGATSTTSGSPSVPTAGASTSGGGTSPTTTPTQPPKHKPSPNETRAPRLVVPQALLSLDGPRSLSIGVPAVAVKPMYTRDELVAFGQKQRFEVTAPVLSVAF